MRFLSSEEEILVTQGKRALAICCHAGKLLLESAVYCVLFLIWKFNENCCNIKKSLDVVRRKRHGSS